MQLSSAGTRPIAKRAASRGRTGEQFKRGCSIAGLALPAPKTVLREDTYIPNLEIVSFNTSADRRSLSTSS